MGDHQRCSVCHCFCGNFTDVSFSLGIERAGGLIQNQDGTIKGQGTGKSDQLLLSDGKTKTILGNLRFITVSQFEDDVIYICCTRSLSYLCLTDMVIPKPDV